MQFSRHFLLTLFKLCKNVKFMHAGIFFAGIWPGFARLYLLYIPPFLLMIKFNILITIIQLFHKSLSDHEPFPELLFTHVFDVSHDVTIFKEALRGDRVSEFTESALHV